MDPGASGGLSGRLAAHCRAFYRVTTAGWLCPASIRYFESAPAELRVMIGQGRGNAAAIPPYCPNALVSGQSSPPASPRRYRASSSLDLWASNRRTSRRLPFTRGMGIES